MSSLVVLHTGITSEQFNPPEPRGAL